MQPKTFGRAVGIGARIAGKALLDPKAPADPDEIARRAAAQTQAQAQAVQAAGKQGRVFGVALGQGTRNLGRGGRNFGRAVWNPFALATGVLWLEITGMFFALFALFFAQHVYALRGAWHGGAEHGRLLLYGALTLLFLYFSASSFLRAARKQRRARS